VGLSGFRHTWRVQIFRSWPNKCRNIMGPDLAFRVSNQDGSRAYLQVPLHAEARCARPSLGPHFLDSANMVSLGIWDLGEGAGEGILQTSALLALPLRLCPCSPGALPAGAERLRTPDPWQAAARVLLASHQHQLRAGARGRAVLDPGEHLPAGRQTFLIYRFGVCRHNAREREMIAMTLPWTVNPHDHHDYWPFLIITHNICMEVI
jgi:hypothetical protein